MSTRLVLAVLCLFSSFLLFMFSGLMKSRSVSFAMICAKHDWDPAQKAHALTKAALMYLVAGLVALFGEIIWGWFFRTPTGYGIFRFFSRNSSRLVRTIFGGRGGNNNIYSSLKNSDNSSDDGHSGSGYARRRGGGATGGETTTSESDFEMMNSAGTERRRLPTHLRRSKNHHHQNNDINNSSNNTTSRVGGRRSVASNSGSDEGGGGNMQFGGIGRLPTRDVDAPIPPNATSASTGSGTSGTNYY